MYIYIYMQYYSQTCEAEHNKNCNTEYKQLIQNQSIEDPPRQPLGLQVTGEDANVNAETSLS